MNRSRRLLAAAVTVAAVLGAISFASAASLPLTGPILTAATVPHPCPGTAAATAATGSGLTYSAASVTMPAGCTGKLLTLRMTSGTTTLTGTATVSGSGATVVGFVPATTYNATLAWAIQATVDGWNLPTTWSFTLPHIWCTVVTTGSTATCTATVTLVTRPNPESGVIRDYYDVVVQTDSDTYVRWEVGFQLDHAFYGGAPDSLGNSNFDLFWDGSTTWSQGSNYTPTTVAARAGQCEELPVLRVRGNSSYRWGDWQNDFRDVRSDRERHFTFVLNLTGDYDDVVYHNCW